MISLKWKIQAWHAAILAAVLAALGVSFYFIERNHRLTSLDFKLQQTIPKLIHSMRVDMGAARGPETRNGALKSEARPLPPEGWEYDERSFSPRNTHASEIESGKASLEGIESQLADYGFYSIAWSPRSGELIHRSEHAPEYQLPDAPMGAYLIRTYDVRYREMLSGIPRFSLIVGFDLVHVYADLALLKWQIFGILTALFFVSVGIGSWLVERSLVPLKVIQNTTSLITQGKLSERIPKHTGGNVIEMAELTANLNQAFLQLDELFQRQVRFTADASHELRNPLSVLIGQIDAGREQPRSVEEHKEILEICGRSARRIQRITDDLMELFRYDSGRFELELEPLPLDQLIGSLAEDLEPIVAAHGSTLHTELSSVIRPCDPFRLEQVINNLVNNALQHNPKPIEITLRVAPEGECARIEVIDNGKGIRPENLSKLFDRFYQESASRTKSRRNLNVGLGLSISQAIVKAHGGSLSVTSTPGERTTFSIVI